MAGRGTLLSMAELRTEALYLADVDLTETEAEVLAVEGRALVVDQTVLYASAGGQPHDTGAIDGQRVIDVYKDGRAIWHLLDGDAAMPSVGDRVTITLDWDRRFQLMRTHTAMHLLGGVMQRDYDVAVTGGNMEPLSGRLDFEFPEVPAGFKESLTERLMAEVAADRPIEVSFVSREDFVLDPTLVRTKTNLVPELLDVVRVVDIVGLDRQADGGTHVHRTGQVGALSVRKVESKGRGFRRVRVELEPGE